MASMWAHSLKELTRFQAPEQERHPDALELIVGERRARSEVGAKHVKGAHRGPKALPCRRVVRPRGLLIVRPTRAP